MREEMCGRVQHIEEADMKCEKIFLQPAGSEEGLKEIDTMFSGNLVNYIEGVSSKIKTDFHEKPDSVFKTALGGDKGGGEIHEVPFSDMSSGNFSFRCSYFLYVRGFRLSRKYVQGILVLFSVWQTQTSGFRDIR